MPFIDRVIQFMQSQGGECLIIASDHECVMRRPDGTTSTVPQRLSLAQVNGMLHEIMPDEHRSQFAASEDFTFPYHFGDRTLDVEVTHPDGTISVCIGPRAAPP